jgi:hypothetical protein
MMAQNAGHCSEIFSHSPHGASLRLRHSLADFAKAATISVCAFEICVGGMRQTKRPGIAARPVAFRSWLRA